jgi:glycosyltransferase involved in cell wall biosynthesis
MKISAVIIAFNEEDKIANAIKSVLWADEVLLVDGESTDRTREIAEGLGARVVVRPWPGFSAQKQFGVDHAANDRIFSLDADEVVSPDLRREIEAIKTSDDPSEAAGYRIPRLAYYMGRPIRHSGWYPDPQLRLFDRRRGKWKDVLVHESVSVEPGARVERLTGDILHYSMESVAQHHEMIGSRYAPLAARQMFNSGKRTNPLKLAAAGPLAFLSGYVLKAGFLDGMPGFCIARLAAHHGFMKHVLLWELQKADAVTTIQR